MKKTLLSAAVALSCLSASAFAGDIATVNGKGIPEERQDALVKALVNRGVKDTPELRAGIKEQLIGQEVLLQEAENQGIASTDEVKKALEEARKQFLLVGLKAKFIKDNQVSDADVKAAYDKLAAQTKGQKEYHLKHILVASEADANAVAKQVARGNFDKVAKSKSIDKASAERGGDLGWNLGPAWGKPILDAVSAVKKGGVTKPVQTPAGWHVFKVVDSKNAVVPPFDQVKTKLKASLEEMKWQEYMINLRKKADVK